MIELLVVLVILGLLAATVTPALDAWLNSRNAAAIRDELAGKLALLPLQASRQSQAIRIENIEQLGLAEQGIMVLEPIQVQANGYCLGGKVAIQRDTARIEFIVSQPFCELSRVEPT